MILNLEKQHFSNVQKVLDGKIVYFCSRQGLLKRYVLSFAVCLCGLYMKNITSNQKQFDNLNIVMIIPALHSSHIMLIYLICLKETEQKSMPCSQIIANSFRRQYLNLLQTDVYRLETYYQCLTRKDSTEKRQKRVTCIHTSLESAGSALGHGATYEQTKDDCGGRANNCLITNVFSRREEEAAEWAQTKTRGEETAEKQPCPRILRRDEPPQQTAPGRSPIPPHVGAA